MNKKTKDKRCSISSSRTQIILSIITNYYDSNYYYNDIFKFKSYFILSSFPLITLPSVISINQKVGLYERRKVSSNSRLMLLNFFFLYCSTERKSLG